MESVKKYAYYPLLIALTLPQLSFAQNIWKGTSCAVEGGGPTKPCGLCDLLVVGMNIIDVLTQASFLIVAAVVVWGAFLMITSAGSDSKMAEGKKKITSAVIGLIVVLTAWVIVNTAFMAIAAISGASEISWNSIKC